MQKAILLELIKLLNLLIQDMLQVILTEPREMGVTEYDD